MTSHGYVASLPPRKIRKSRKILETKHGDAGVSAVQGMLHLAAAAIMKTRLSQPAVYYTAAAACTSDVRPATHVPWRLLHFDWVDRQHVGHPVSIVHHLMHSGSVTSLPMSFPLHN